MVVPSARERGGLRPVLRDILADPWPRQAVATASEAVLVRKKTQLSEYERRAAAILEVVRRIPRGRVTTYGAVAARAGLARQARLVGKVLGRLPATSRVPWQRVVAAGGRIAFPAGSEPRALQVGKLRAEGVELTGERVNLARYGWGTPAGDDLDQWLWSRDSTTRRTRGACPESL